MVRHHCRAAVAALSAAGMLFSPGCHRSPSGDLAGSVAIDGSSTVYPITEAVAEELRHEQPGIRVTVGVSGTGGGFKRFAQGEIDIADASRPIKPREAAAIDRAGLDFIELPVAYDGLSIVVNRENDFVDQLTIADLREIFLADGSARTWKQVDPDWPDRPIKVYSPGTDSGTFDYFKEVVASEQGDAIRSDISVSEDDNVLVTGVAGDADAIAYFGFAYYSENRDKLKVVPIVNPDSGRAVIPTLQTIESGRYAPFSRPLLIYVNADSAVKPAVRACVEFYLRNAAFLAEEVGYVPLPRAVYEKAEASFQALHTGSVFLHEGEAATGSIVELYGLR